ncbi:carbohydrate ABC transporter permease [Nakamurella sp. PAMC28650]|uniref:carbohydrate ABC transporter permease n=1 Tax=Nakamurella sp. PAMC28650 TaxID=2762325 RepID=UPI00164E1D1F|nr:sugar ABC transporter permease [Nakamurella sp. PAMC28650]QNK79702.1 sugar ABC transporter permease [Nakamurella sp. PAMC28650]
MSGTETNIGAKAEVERVSRRSHGGSAGVTRRGGGRFDRRFGWPWIFPAMIVSVGVLYYCIGYTGYISTLNWDGASPDRLAVGAHNYTQLFADPVFWKAIQHTAVFFVATFILQVALGLLFAVILHSRVGLRVVYKVFIFLPVVLAPATMAPVFRQIFAPDGQFNGVLRSLGLGHFAYAWLASPDTALMVIVAVAVWQSTGVVFVLYYASMSQIQPEVMEAARLDGAGNITMIRTIIWPGVRGTTLAIAILTAIGSLKTFDWPFLITQGGPSYGTEFLGTQIYRVSVALSQVGYGAAISIVLLVLALGTAVILNVAGRERKS